MANRRDAYLIEKKRATAKSEFYIHLIVGLGAGVVLTLISAGIYPSSFWVIWPLLGWAAATLFNYLRVFVFTKKTVLKNGH